MFKHTPLLSTKNVNEIETQSGMTFINSSYINDGCDSVSNYEYNIHIFLPNVTLEKHDEMDEESFPHYCVSKNDVYVIEEANQEEVIKYLKEIQ